MTIIEHIVIALGFILLCYGFYLSFKRRMGNMNDKMICTEVTITFDDYNMLLGKILNLEDRLAEVEKERDEAKELFKVFCDRAEFADKEAATAQVQIKKLEEELKLAREAMEKAKEALGESKIHIHEEYCCSHFNGPTPIDQKIEAALTALDAALGGKEG